VNDPPWLAPLSDRALSEHAPEQSVLLSGILAGPDNERGQALMVSARSSNPDLIPHPTLDYVSPEGRGTLILAPARKATGTATISVMVRDDGGVEHGAVDTVTRSFTVEVLPTIQLTIQRNGDVVTLSWPLAAKDFVLESTSDLSTWTPVAETIPVIDNSFVLRLVPAGDRRFYRLSKK
jgi:hypothetical protein